MALASFNELKSSVKDWAKRQSLGDTLLADFVTMTESVFNYGDEANGISPVRTRDMETTATITVSSGQGDLPSDFLEMIKVKDPGAITRTLEYATPDWLDEQYPLGQDTTYPHYYTVIGGALVCPIDVSVTYYAKLETIVSGNSNWLLEKAPNAYLFGALMHYAIWDKDAEKAVQYRGLMQGALAGLAYSDRNARAGSVSRRPTGPAY